VQANPVLGIRPPRVTRQRRRVLEPVEVARVLKALGDARAKRIFLTLTLTGLRRFELQNLRWSHVDLLEATLRVEESETEEGERLIALPTKLVDELATHFAESKYRSDADFVFCHPSGARGSITSGTPTSSGRRWQQPGSRTTCGPSTTPATGR